MNETRFYQSPRQVPVVSEGNNSNNNDSDNNNKTKSRFSLLRFFNFKKILKFFATIVILVVVLFVLFLSKDFITGIFKKDTEVYSAVFLTNGQVYFGKIIDNNKLEIVLSNVYYIQVNEKTTPENTASTVNQNSFNLIKLGNELHGPTDELFVNRSQVIFYEKLRDDSKVFESIKNYKVQ